MLLYTCDQRPALPTVTKSNNTAVAATVSYVAPPEGGLVRGRAFPPASQPLPAEEAEEWQRADDEEQAEQGLNASGRLLPAPTSRRPERLQQDGVRDRLMAAPVRLREKVSFLSACATLVAAGVAADNHLTKL